MWWTVRATLADSPGTLAGITAACGRHGINILGLQIYPGLGQVLDELVLDTPPGWTAADLTDLIGAAGGVAVEVEARAEEVLVDETVRWLRAAERVLESPEHVAAVRAGLTGGSPTEVEEARLAAWESLLDAAAGPGRASPSEIEYAVAGAAVAARTGGRVVATGELATAPRRAPEARVEVAPAWRRRGIGGEVLTRLIALARESGADEVVLLAPAGDEGTLPMLDALGLRGRIRMNGEDLRVRLVVGERHRLDAPTSRDR